MYKLTFNVYFIFKGTTWICELVFALSYGGDTDFL